MTSSFATTLRKILSNKNVGVFIVADVLFLLGGFLWWPFQPLYILELGASKEELGTLLMLSSAGMLLFQIPGGFLADRFGRKKIILCGATLRCIPPAIFALANHWILLVPGVFMNSLSIIDAPAWNALLVESLPRENRGAGYGVYRTLISMSGIFTTPLGGVLMDSMGVIEGTRLCLAFNEVMLVTHTLILLKFLADTKTGGKVEDGVCERRGGRATVTQSLRVIPRRIWTLILVQGLVSFASGLSMSFTVVYANEVIGLSKTEWGVASTLLSLFSTTIATPTGFLADRVGRKPCILTSQVLSSISTLFFINSHNFGGVLFSRTLEGVASGFGGMVMGFMGGPAWQALIADFVPGRDRGKMMGLIGAMTGTISTPSAFVGGYLYESFSPALPFQLNIAIMVTAAVIFLLFLGEPKEKAV